MQLNIPLSRLAYLNKSLDIIIMFTYWVLGCSLLGICFFYTFIVFNLDLERFRLPDWISSVSKKCIYLRYKC